MAMMKELFMKYQEEMRGQDDLIDDEYSFQQWCEQQSIENEYWQQSTHDVDNGWTDELAELNDRIQTKYSDMDIESVLHKVLGDANPLVDEIKKELNNLNSIRNGYFD
jgi:hypothetical protein